MTRTLLLKFTSACLLAVAVNTVCLSQQQSVDKLDKQYLDWHNRDYKQEKILGTSVNRVYKELIAGRTPAKTVVVAVIDSGIDIDHEDLKERIWINEDEVPGNEIDDDKNGYVDDVHGWNFIGNQNGENVMYETMEYTRLYKEGGGPHFEKAKELWEKEVDRQLDDKKNLERFEDALNRAKILIKEETGINVTSLKDLDGVTPKYGQDVMTARNFLKSRYEMGFRDELLAELKKNNSEYMEKFLNPDFNPRSIVGDNPLDINDTDYGNPDVKGPRPDHGTSVAGVIAAVRNNNVGVDGIATHVKIMCLRSTPRGDERDKDVALAIRYAVDNGADIINMSFGKAISPQKEFVDAAVKYAESKGVLMVHGSGNSGRDLDVEDSYPSDRLLDGNEATNWITVGASFMNDDEEVAAVFSNYGQKHVDIFAPGQNIISTDSSNTYNMHDGTSLAAPMVSGIAALVLSYYPDLTPQQLISILMESAYRIDRKVRAPGSSGKEARKVRFSTLSKSGGIVNAFEAMKKAEALK